MQYKCETCYDTGSRDQIGTYLDCNECGVAQTRRDLNDFVKSLGPTHPEDVALAIHQRALAMATKQEARQIIDELGEFEDWAKEHLGQGYSLETEEHTYVNPVTRWAFVAFKAGLKIVAAPAAANGAPEGEAIGTLMRSSDETIIFTAIGDPHITDGMSVFAAAGPDAALVELIQKHWNGAYFQGVTKAEAREINEVLALSGAKGNA